MFKHIIPLALVGLVVLTAGAWAEGTNWGNQTELSFVQSDGNSEVTTFAGNNILTLKQGEALFYTWEVGALYGESDDQRNSERYFTKLRGDYLLTERSYAALIGGWNKDNFAGIDSRYYAGAVSGYKLLEGPTHLWAAEAGADYVAEEYTDDTDRDYPRGRIFTEYQYLFTEKNRFLQSVEYLHDFDESRNYNLNTETAISSAINDALSLKASFKLYYDNDPVPATLDDTDTLLTVALVINI